MQTVSKCYCLPHPGQFIMARVEAAWLPIACNIDVGEVWKEEGDFRSKPSSITAGILPIITCVVRPGRFHAIQHGIRPEEVLLTPGSEHAQNSASVRQNQQPGSIIGLKELGRLSDRMQRGY